MNFGESGETMWWVTSKGATRYTTAWLLSAIGLISLGCVPTPTEPAPDAGLPFAPGGCGLPAYTWLPADEVGHVVQADVHPLSPLAQADIDTILADVGIADVGPAQSGVELFRLRYGTQDKGEPVEATGLVAIPWIERDAPQPFPVVLWLHGTTGFTGECAPSGLGAENLAIAFLAALGFVVVAPDYIGLDADHPDVIPPSPRHVYLGAEQTALGSLDMLRATKALLSQIPTGARLDGRTVIWGGSQGGHAAFSTDLFAPYYAPDVDVTAMVAAVPPTDLVAHGQYAVSGLSAASAALPASMIAMARWFDRPDAIEDAIRNDAPVYFASSLGDAMDQTCDFDDVADAVATLEDIFTDEPLQNPEFFAAAEPWACFFQRNSIVATDIPRARQTPTLFQISELDTLVHADTERVSFGKLCERGYRLWFLECAQAGHTQGALWSLREQISFVRARLSGEPFDEMTECQEQAPTWCSGTPDDVRGSIGM